MNKTHKSDFSESNHMNRIPLAVYLLEEKGKIYT